jgi:hypothetical protein
VVLQDLPDIKYQGGAIGVGKRLDANAGLTAAGTVALPAAATIGGLTVADPNVIQPADHALIAWSYDPSFASTGNLLTNGTFYLSAVRLRRTATIATVWWAQSAAGVTATSGQNFACLINSAGTILSSVGVDAKVTGSGPQTATLGTPQTNLPAGLYWVGLLFNAATAPTAARTNGIQTAINTAGQSGATLRYATNGTSLTALPGSVTPGSNAIGPSLWAAVS